MSAEHRLCDVCGVHTDLVVARAEVQLGEELGAMQLIQQFIDQRNRVRVLDGDGIEGSVVDAEPPRSVGFLDEEDGGKRTPTCYDG